LFRKDFVFSVPRFTPRGGDFWIFKIGFGPSPKNLSKTVSAPETG
jgi:hypothetical protein